MSHEKLVQEIDQLSEQLKTLRLPHKLNQYRSYEKRLLSLRKLSENVPDKSYQAQLDQLQNQLDNSVLCGVSQCFLCASNQNALPNKVPLYNRSVSAGMVHKSRYSSNANGAQIPKFGKQISYHHQLTKKKEEPLLREAPPTPPASIHSEDSADQCESNVSPVHIEPVINDKSENGTNNAETNTPVFTSTSDNIPKESGKSQNYLDHVENSTSTSTSDITPKDNNKSEHILKVKQTEVNQNGEQSHSNVKDTSTVLTSSADSNAEKPRTSLSYINNKVMTKSNMVAGPLPFRTSSSYRTYKDFVNNYSVTDRNKKSEVPDKRAA